MVSEYLQKSYSNPRVLADTSIKPGFQCPLPGQHERVFLQSVLVAKAVSASLEVSGAKHIRMRKLQTIKFLLEIICLCH